jgi:hypothetical protein
MREPTLFLKLFFVTLVLVTITALASVPLAWRPKE